MKVSSTLWVRFPILVWPHHDISTQLTDTLSNSIRGWSWGYWAKGNVKLTVFLFGHVRKRHSRRQIEKKSNFRISFQARSYPPTTATHLPVKSFREQDTFGVHYQQNSSGPFKAKVAWFITEFKYPYCEWLKYVLQNNTETTELVPLNKINNNL